MEKFKRSLFFWFLVLVFFVLAPSVVLYSTGYRFDLKRGVFVHSGTITIKTNPQTVDVQLNNELRQSKALNRINNSYNLSGLLPRNYNITISLPDYQTWSKKADVHSGLSSEFWNVILVRDEYKKTEYETVGIDRFFTSPQNGFIAYNKKESNGVSINIFNLDSESLENTSSFENWSLLPEKARENIEWSPQENYLSVPLEKEEISSTSDTKTTAVSPAKKTATGAENQTRFVRNYFIINPDQKNFFNLNEFLGKEEIRNVRWDPQSENYLFFLEGTTLFRANIEDKNDLAIISEDVSAFDFSRSAIYFVKKPNNLVFRSSFDGQSSKDQVTFQFPEDGKNVQQLIVYDEWRIGFLTEDRKLFAFSRTDKETRFKKLSENIEGIQFSDDGKKLLFWTPNEISVYFLRAWEVQPIRAEDETQNITRYSEPLRNVQWFKDYEHIIFSTGSFTKIIELDGRDHRNTMDLINTTLEKPFVIFNNSLEKLYFTDNSSSSESSETKLKSIIFPEPIPILGIGG